MAFTPRQIAACLAFAGEIDQRRMRDELMLHALASRGEKKAFDKMLKDLSRGLNE